LSPAAQPTNAISFRLYDWHGYRVVLTF
jgi:hypothetical protein